MPSMAGRIRRGLERLRDLPVAVLLFEGNGLRFWVGGIGDRQRLDFVRLKGEGGLVLSVAGFAASFCAAFPVEIIGSSADENGGDEND